MLGGGFLEEWSLSLPWRIDKMCVSGGEGKGICAMGSCMKKAWIRSEEEYLCWRKWGGTWLHWTNQWGEIEGNRAGKERVLQGPHLVFAARHSSTASPSGSVHPLARGLDANCSVCTVKGLSYLTSKSLYRNCHSYSGCGEVAVLWVLGFNRYRRHLT